MTKAQTKKCAIYTRVSTDIQAEKEFSSCQSQEEKIRSFVESQNNWQIFKVYSDAGYTGANTNRPALKELLEDIKEEGIDIILSYKIDRLTRSPKDFYHLIEVFEKYKVSFVSITERFDTSTPAGRLLRNIMLTFAQFERELVSERTKDKMLERAKKGLCSGGFAPFGYERKNKKFIINKKEAKIIRLIFETYVKDGCLGKVYDLLKEKKIKNKKGKPFRKPSITYILRNVVYAGKVKFGDQVFKGIHQPIISEDLFELTQKTHKKRKRKYRVYKNYLFGGLIDCKECGYKMTPSFTNKHSKGKMKRYYYYRCTSVDKKGWQACSTKQVSATRLERYILESLKRIFLDKSYIENLVFKLNHSVHGSKDSLKKTGSPPNKKYEPSKVCSKFSSEAIISLLKSFLKFLSQRRGVERNLLVKRFIEKIVYSKQDIEIKLFYGLNSQVSCIQNKTALRKQGSSNFSGRSEASSLPPQLERFDFDNIG